MTHTFTEVESAGIFIAAATYWSRLEALPMTADLAPGLQAPVADPLWFITRQWQFEELHGEDAGTPIEVRIGGDHNVLERYLAGAIDPNAPADDAANRAVDYAALSWPLEPVVEAELARDIEHNGRHDGSDRLRSEGGLQFLRLLAVHVTNGDVAGSLRDAYRDHYALDPPGPEFSDDPDGTARRTLLAGRVPDGARIAADLVPLLDGNNVLGGLPDEPPVPAAQRDQVVAAAAEWLTWWNGQLLEPGTDHPSSWNAHRLEYALALQTRLSEGPVTLVADEYTDGRLDWYAFAARSSPSLGDPQTASVPTEFHEVLLPTNATFPGRPADRYWEFEDAEVFLGALDAGPTDLARLLLVEFALAYGNDWFVVPLELPSGSVCHIGSFTVTDTFGITADVAPSRNLDGTRWTMFNLAAPDDRSFLADCFFLPPVLPRKLEGAPIEEVVLFRDEMANLVWGVERVVAGPSGERIDRAARAKRVSLRQSMPGDLRDAKIVYRLMTPVPEHWYPFVAVPADGQPTDDFIIELERRSMIRLLPDGTTDEPQPLGLLLRQDPTEAVEQDHLRLAEEEVPRSGIVVTRSFQHGRLPDGRYVLWLGRRKGTGRGEGASGLRFDTAIPPDLLAPPPTP